MLGYVDDPMVKNAEQEKRFKKAKSQARSARETNAKKKRSVGNAATRASLRCRKKSKQRKLTAVIKVEGTGVATELMGTNEGRDTRQKRVGSVEVKIIFHRGLHNFI